MKKIIAMGAASLVLQFVFAGSALAEVVVPPPPPPAPTSVDQCKKGGWENYAGLFKNQGDCVSYVVTDGRNEPSGPAA